MIQACSAKALHCSCRDCFAVVLGPLGTLCEGCSEACCDTFYTRCRQPGAYALRPKAACACCAGRPRTSRLRLEMCADCRESGCEWTHAHCIRVDAQAPTDALVCLGCGGSVEAEGYDLCGRCAAGGVAS